MQTITKVFESYEQARNAVDALEAAGIPMSEISVLATRAVAEEEGELATTEPTTEETAGADIGASIGGAAGLATGIGLMAIPGLGQFAAAGWLATTALGAVAGGAAGGIIGLLIRGGVSEEQAQHFSEAVTGGGTLVSVQAEDHNVALVHSTLDSFSPLEQLQRDGVSHNGERKILEPTAGPYESTRAAVERE